MLALQLFQFFPLSNLAAHQLIVSCSRDKTIRIWDLYTGECIRILEGHTDWVYCIAISPDGKTLVSCSRDKTVKIWG
ncbi:MAG: hypothetical protein SWZ49_24215 [Cyanobacteriota bacterium]|nr:hypothetical protein [Cyanobacteriota bacterium]